MGTGDIAIPTFEYLLSEKEFEVILITQPDKPVGRKQVLTAPRIKEIALANQISIFQPENLKSEESVNFLSEVDADLFVVMAYGQILSQEVLDLPRLGCINLHASLLPLYRGAACIQAPISNGDEYTGITIMHMTKGLDEGDIISSKKLKIGKCETGGMLHDRLSEMSPSTLATVLNDLKMGTAPRTAQNDELSSYVPKLLRSHGEIDWNDSAESLERKIRAYDPWPGTFTTFSNQKMRVSRLKIFPVVELSNLEGNPGEVIAVDTDSFTVACGSLSLKILKVQPEGGRVMNSVEFLTSPAIELGKVLGV